MIPFARSRPAATVAVTVVCGLVAFSTSARAQEKKPVGIRGVEVVATRLPEMPHDVPASIEVISGQSLRDRGAVTLRDALSLATGISIAPGGDQGPAGAVPEIWGLREFDAFLLVVDNIPWGGAFNPAVTALALHDVERIEILRGPAPVTYGATSFVGVIHVVHKAAAEKTTYLSATGGTYGTGSVAADFVLPSSSAWKSRGTVDAERMGFKDDRTSYQRAHTLLRTAKVENDKTMWGTVDVDILRQNPASPHPREGPELSTQTPLDANYNPDGAHLNDARFALMAGFELPAFSGAKWGTTASFTHAAERIYRGFLKPDLPTGANNAAGFKENIDINDFYADSHIIWKEFSKLRILTGADILMAAGEGKGATFEYTAPFVSSAVPTAVEPTALNQDSENERRFIGLYGSAEWRPTARLTVSGGIRLNSTAEKHDENSEEVTNTKPSGSVGVLLGLWENGANHIRAFGNFRSTFKPAAFDFGLEEGEEEEAVLKPETSRNYEGGLKLRTLDGRLNVEGSYFNLDFENLVTATVINNQPRLTNAGKTRFKGFELAADAELAHDVYARATYSAHDSKFVDYVQDFGGVATQLAGKRFELSAKSLASAGLTFAPEVGFIAHASMNYVGDRFLNKRNTAPAEAFSTFDAGVGYRKGRIEVRVDGRNLGDRRDPVSESEFGDAQYYRMTARTIQAGVEIKY